MYNPFFLEWSLLKSLLRFIFGHRPQLVWQHGYYSEKGGWLPGRYAVRRLP